MINGLIIEDEEMASKHLNHVCSKFSNITIKGSFLNGLEARDAIAKNKIDFLLLDIENPDLSGIDFIKYGKNIPPVIFISGNKSYRDSVEKLGAVAFLEKPIMVNKLYEALEKISYNKEINTSTSNTEENFYKFEVKKKLTDKDLSIKLENASSVNLNINFNKENPIAMVKEEPNLRAIINWKPVWSKW